MATYPVKEFAEKLGVKPQTVNTWGKRGKLHIVNGKINDSHPKNKSFLKERNEIEAEITILGGDIETEKKKRSTNNTPDDTSESAIRKAAENLLKADYTREQTKYLQLRNQKLEGSLISTDLVGRSVAEVVQRYKASFVQRMDQLLRDYFNANQIDNATLIAALSELTDIANEVSHRANEEAKASIYNSLHDTLR